MGSGEDFWDGGWGDRPPWFPAPPVAGPDIELLDSLDAVLRSIGARHEDVLRRRVGLGDVEHQTLQEIGDEYGLTRERIRQIQVKALIRVRTHMTRFSRQPERPEAVLHQRLASQLRALRRGERGMYLRMTFPGTNVQMLSELLELCGSARSRQDRCMGQRERRR